MLFHQRPVVPIAICMWCCAVLTSPTLGAQAPRAGQPQALVTPALRALRAAEALVLRGDSSAAIALLDSALAHDRRDAVLWHRYAELVWSDRTRTLRSY